MTDNNPKERLRSRKFAVLATLIKRLGVLTLLNLAMTLVGVGIVLGLQAATTRQGATERVTIAPTLSATLMPAPADLDPQALLAKSDAAMNQLRSVSEVRYLWSDVGSGVTTTIQFQSPDKLRFTVSNGNEAVAIDGTQYDREPSKPWEKTQRPFPVRWPNYDYSQTASQATVEGAEVIDGELSAVVTFKAPKIDLYRHWIGLNTGLLRKQQMIASGHNMLSTFSQFSAPMEIVTPTENVVTPTPSAVLPPMTLNYAATELLTKSDAAMNQLRSLIEIEVLGDDSGNTLTTTIHYLVPDRLRFKVSDGTESVAIRDTQYYLKPGQPWEKITRAEPVRWPDFNHALFISPFKVEGKALVDGEWCIVLALKTGTMTYRFWIGEDTNWVRRWQMDGPNHHMLTTFSNFNAPLDIVAPPSGK